MTYQISPYIGYVTSISKRVEKFINELSHNDQVVYVEKIAKLTTQEFQTLDIKKLQGFKDLYRIKVGDYQIVYKPIREQKVILVALIAHRREVYQMIKNLSPLIKA